MKQPIFLKPYFQEKIWGGNKLNKVYGYDIPSDRTGECWAISAHPHGTSVVENGPYTGMNLAELWDQHREIFGNAKEDVFPLLTKILDAREDLSVQVHPDDTYALKHEHELGKTECWYVLAADEGAEMIYGHHAKTRAELAEWIENGKWDKLLRHVPVKPGDFLYVPSGTVHAIGKGIMVLETQQSSDTTYRLYDFDRVDAKTGKKRELHLKQSIDVINVPHVDPKLVQKTTMADDIEITRFVKTDFFTVERWRLNGGKGTIKRQDALYTLVSVIEGQGVLTVNEQQYKLKKGIHFILPFEVKEWSIEGTMDIISSNPGRKE
ncbi:mannose-6-phosphate isomerase, class I [Ligilactobacillus sp. WILCCON 0076]|uniref:Mannose-6-phosphate isomerase n=1 Tax=Ligilactobacillus ubinensis TaxID=2876789 RepID=A0A9X2FHY9_9LACO|nr:mannose-6-phosphate isomerase, class I [Ligilactobacillus ubinensis]MCP0885969.1 mannose-6-phosphate isomerase, class I [Ligilactobacillus ubinensis]